MSEGRRRFPEGEASSREIALRLLAALFMLAAGIIAVAIAVLAVQSAIAG